MKKVAALIGNEFEDSEYTDPAEAFFGAGHTIVNVGLEKGATVTGKHGTAVLIDEPVETAAVDDFDALFIPGGHSPDLLRADKNAVLFVRKFVESGKPVLIICHGPQLLITADVLRGRKTTGWKSIEQDIRNAGAEFVDQEVVVDGNMVASRNPGDIPAFISASLKALS
ncbi:MAG TPA: type 1 glutamine amidotransferase domain-containing protein [Thermodesulfobacteriota bacterium]|nr:type 1 glutamine amidotransferase [Deltaproteobacteria bacterium]HNR12328.1 type 1 glutamine amidotransferase domain-containing protein [Thermodesulfobacteriota bacterium]HNU71287.1 type 1 glutamine amidotransferase domain-containing protein [Thermodesulfobacteriota bacterium]HOC39126.1 type 1 glutamine amidotransferase domain-containing protein [Thermodesulfobacteriota bacterium]